MGGGGGVWLGCGFLVFATRGGVVWFFGVLFAVGYKYVIVCGFGAANGVCGYCIVVVGLQLAAFNIWVFAVVFGGVCSNFAVGLQ